MTSEGVRVGRAASDKEERSGSGQQKQQHALKVMGGFGFGGERRRASQ